MSVRTTPANVADVIKVDSTISLTAFIATASSLVDKVASNDSGSLLSASDLELVERWLAAHMYAHRDQLLSSKSHGGASGSFQGQSGMALDATIYGQTAKVLDVTGHLAKLDQQSKTGKQSGSMTWLGTDYKDDEAKANETNWST